MLESNYFINRFHLTKFNFPILLFSIICGAMVSNSVVEWKDTTSEGNYFDFYIKTHSKIIPEKQNFLNYTIQIGYSKTQGILINYYPILEFHESEKRIIDKRTVFLNGNVTTQFEILLEKGKNKWSLGIEPFNSDMPEIIHHGTFDEVYRNNDG